MALHIWPVEDIKPHETDGKPCWCSPKVELLEDGTMMYTHRYAEQEEWDAMNKHQTVEAHGKEWSIGMN